jgi:hypothetical protein
MSQSGMTARPAEQNRGSDSVERLLGIFIRVGQRGKWFAWHPVPLCKYVKLPNGNGQWQPMGWTWLREVPWVKHCVSGEVTYFMDTEKCPYCLGMGFEVWYNKWGKELLETCRCCGGDGYILPNGSDHRHQPGASVETKSNL